MAIIGTFAREGDSFSGEIRTLLLCTQAAFEPNDKKSDKSPDFVLKTPNGTELGVAWEKTSKDGVIYHSVKMDTPGIAEPIHAALFEGEGGQFELVWSRDKDE